METTVKATPAQVKQAVADYFKEHGLTMAEAGLKMNMSRASVSYALSMQDKYFTRAQAVKYAHTFGMDIEYLTKGEGDLISDDGRTIPVSSSQSGGVFYRIEIPKELQEQMKQHEERRLKEAQSALVDLTTTIEALDYCLKHYHSIAYKLEKIRSRVPNYDEEVLLIQRKIKELENARAFNEGKISINKRVISDIEEGRARRENPQLWEKTDGIMQEGSVESSATRLLKTYLGGDNVEDIDWESDEDE